MGQDGAWSPGTAAQNNLWFSLRGSQSDAGGMSCAFWVWRFLSIVLAVVLGDDRSLLAQFVRFVSGAGATVPGGGVTGDTCGAQVCGWGPSGTCHSPPRR